MLGNVNIKKVKRLEILVKKGVNLMKIDKEKFIKDIEKDLGIKNMKNK